MIRYLSDEEKKLSRNLYQQAFPEDSKAFVDYYYHYVIKDNRILVLERDGEICSMLHLNPYRLSVRGQAVDAYYYVAVATGKDCRHQGMMRKLLEKSLRDIHGEGHPFAYLMPANRAIYEPFGFRIVYEQKKISLPMNPEKANEKMAKIFDLYTLRDDWYVEKMLEEARVCAGEAPFDIIPYIMMRITCVERMLELLRSNATRSVLLQITDELIPENNGNFLWEVSKTKSVCRKLEEIYSECGEILKISIGIAELTEFVFGKRKIEGLEEIEVLKNICINESV